MKNREQIFLNVFYAAVSVFVTAVFLEAEIMIIDFHTHAFNDKIAEKAIARLVDVAKMEVYSDGKIGGIQAQIDKGLIDKAVMLPVATKPTQQTIINDWAAEMQNTHPDIISFGSVHPDADDVFEELERVKEMGLHGVKFHPDYQNFFIDEEKCFPIYRKCAELGLPAVFHAGWDPLSPDVIHAVPQASRRAHDAVPEMTMILAHMGGMNCWDDVEKYLVGQDNIYFDTAIVDRNIDDEQCERIFKNHGTDRILFATDFPWHTADMEISLVNRLDLSDEDRERIFHKNAENLLNL